jgi:hypothetical protein
LQKESSKENGIFFARRAKKSPFFPLLDEGQRPFFI